MTLRAVFQLFLLASAPLFACLEYDYTIKYVYYRGTHEQAGILTFIAKSDNLSGASPANPIYIRLTMNGQVRFADTYVLQSSGNPTLASPINLPLKLEGQANVTMVAAADAVRIVRWVAGEDSIWIEVRQSSDLWLNDNGTLTGPSQDNWVTFDLGLSARESDQSNQLGVNANLPFATRNALANEGSFGDALSVLNCIDLSNSKIPVNDFVNNDITYYLSDANQGGGIYAPASFLGCIEFPVEHPLALSKDQFCEQNEAQLQPAQILSGPAGLSRIHQSISAYQSCAEGSNNITPVWAEGSFVHLTALAPNSGFEHNPNVNFATWSGVAAVRPGSAFQLNGLTLYRELDLYYLGPDQANGQDLNLEVELIYAPEGGSQPQLNLETVLLPFASANDGAPYNLPSQVLRCTPEPYVFASQTVSLGVATVPTLGEAALFILIMALLGLAVSHLRRNPQSAV